MELTYTGCPGNQGFGSNNRGSIIYYYTELRYRHALISNRVRSNSHSIAPTYMYIHVAIKVFTHLLEDSNDLPNSLSIQSTR